MQTFTALVDVMAAAADGADFWSLRQVTDRSESLRVRRGRLEPVIDRESRGLFLTVAETGGLGYAATPDLTPAGVRAALEQARVWARATAGRGLFGPASVPRTAATGTYRTPVRRPWSALSAGDKVQWLQGICARLRVDERIVDWEAALHHRTTETRFANSHGARVEQALEFIRPDLAAVAHRPGQTQRRSHGGWDSARQGGLEQLGLLGFPEAAERVAAEALELLDAPDCPADTRHLLLLPGQMALQIHESIGHPLELDRILGDERNFAGTSFVTPDLFGHYRYGSPLLNVTFDPGLPEELASYAYDDEGFPAERQYLIRAGILLRPLGASLSRARSGLPGVANARASGWQRPPIDRMANLNVEPGEGSLASLVAGVERGVLMDTNRSWSIDDSRNKFQFGCEYARLIEDGELRGVVRNPNYRGVSTAFWRSLVGVGGAETFRVHGVTGCGKGEPNQLVQVGHAAPACLFAEVEVFGGV